jgi:hypothetical protein
MYVVEALLATGKTKIMEGLASGTLTRWGGVIRVAAGQPNGGAIVAHLRELAPGLRSIGSLNPVQAASSLVANGQLYNINQKLSSVLRMTNIAAAASVLNLGVSVVGFAIMAAKLNRLQADMNKMLQAQAHNQRELMSQLGDVQQRLIELRFLSLQGHELVLDAINEVRSVRADLLDGYLAKLQARSEHLHLSGIPTGQAIRSAWETFTEARIWLTAGLERGVPDARRPVEVLGHLTRYRAWCFAVTGEVQLARRAHASDAAARIATDAAKLARGWANQWRQALAPETEFGGVLRFRHSRFSDMGAETVLRLDRLQFGDATQIRDRSVLEATNQVAQRAAGFPTEWFERQAATAQMLDFVEETTERLESLASETSWCAEHRIEHEHWEELEASDEAYAEGVGAICLEDAA